MRFRSSRLCIAFALLAVASCAKSDAPTTARVTGTVTAQGKPVPNLYINFLPTQGPPSHGITNAEGKYTLEYGDSQPGAVLDRHTVWVTAAPTGVPDAGPGTAPAIPAEVAAVLKKYGTLDVTPLKDIEVKEDNQVIDIKLD